MVIVHPPYPNLLRLDIDAGSVSVDVVGGLGVLTVASIDTESIARVALSNDDALKIADALQRLVERLREKDR